MKIREDSHMGIQGWRIFSHGNKDEGESVKYLGII
jgi:hypothetical protein